MCVCITYRSKHKQFAGKMKTIDRTLLLRQSEKLESTKGTTFAVDIVS